MLSKDDSFCISFFDEKLSKHFCQGGDKKYCLWMSANNVLTDIAWSAVKSSGKMTYKEYPITNMSRIVEFYYLSMNR